MNMEKDSIYKYKGTGNLYKVLSSNCKMKNPVTRNWDQAVIYQGYKLLKDNKYINDPDRKVWVRELQEFKEKFELWN